MSVENTTLPEVSAESELDGATSSPSSVAEYMATDSQSKAVNEVAQTPIEPDPARDEVERIEPVPTGPVKLECGELVDIVPLKLRETMKLLKIVTRGAGGALESMVGQLDMDDPIAFAQTFAALVMFSIPEAEDEAINFLQSMVLPVNFEAMSDSEKIEKLNKLARELDNPELDDVVTIIERVVRRESEDIRSLGKRIRTAAGMVRQTVRSRPEGS